MSQEYYSVLARTMATVGRDHAQLRAMIYQFARSELKRELLQRKNIQWVEMKQQMAALEQAIQRLEADVTDNALRLTFSPAETMKQTGATNQRPAAEPAAGTALVVRHNSHRSAVANHYDSEILPPVVEIYTPERSRPLPPVRPEPVRPFRPVRAAFWSIFRLAVAVILGVAFFNVFQNHGDLRSLIGRYVPQGAVGKPPGSAGPAQKQMATLADRLNALPSDQQQSFDPRLTLSAQIGDVPIPKSYGVYAVNGGKLIDLQLLPIKVPDQRVAISAIISTPSPVSLPDGRLQFVAFRRDLANRAPDRVQVRIVARVMHALTFDAAGKPRTVGVESAWAVRGKSYEMKVAPVSGSDEMIVIRPDDPGFSFPAGRYALLLNGQAYDFGVDGPITDATQCLERTDALGAAVYTECRNP